MPVAGCEIYLLENRGNRHRTEIRPCHRGKAALRNVFFCVFAGQLPNTGGTCRRAEAGTAAGLGRPFAVKGGSCGNFASL
jgi:hypothetical protein